MNKDGLYLLILVARFTIVISVLNIILKIFSRRTMMILQRREQQRARIELSVASVTNACPSVLHELQSSPQLRVRVVKLLLHITIENADTASIESLIAHYQEHPSAAAHGSFNAYIHDLEIEHDLAPPPLSRVHDPGPLKPNKGA